MFAKIKPCKTPHQNPERATERVENEKPRATCELQIAIITIRMCGIQLMVSALPFSHKRVSPCASLRGLMGDPFRQGKLHPQTPLCRLASMAQFIASSQRIMMGL